MERGNELGQYRDHTPRDSSSFLVDEVQFHPLDEVLDDVRSSRFGILVPLFLESGEGIHATGHVH